MDFPGGRDGLDADGRSASGVNVKSKESCVTILGEFSTHASMQQRHDKMMVGKASRDAREKSSSSLRLFFFATSRGCVDTRDMFLVCCVVFTQLLDDLSSFNGKK